MPAVFATRPGQLVVSAGNAMPAMLLPERFPKYPAISAILTEMSFAGKSILQKQTSLDGSNYLHIFGEAFRPYTIGGLTFDISDCGPPSDVPPPPPGVIRDGGPEGGNGSGAEQILRWYDANRISRNGLLLSITTSGGSISGALSGFAMQTVDIEHRVGMFRLSMDVLPPE